MNEALKNIANKKYNGPDRKNMKFRGKDVTLIINSEGDAITLFIGKRKDNGDITGTRYVRNFKVKNGVETSHWDNKGKV